MKVGEEKKEGKNSISGNLLLINNNLVREIGFYKGLERSLINKGFRFQYSGAGRIYWNSVSNINGLIVSAILLFLSSKKICIFMIHPNDK